MKRQVSPLLIVILSALSMFLSCKPQVPGKYIQPDEFEDILYDYHLAEGMADNGETDNDNPYNSLLYKQAVFKKYGITQAEFDSSLVYYMRHADRLHDIYENLAKRLSNEAMALGASANDISRYGDLASKRDTSNLWTGVSSSVLMPESPYNVMSFDIEADTTYHKGDKIIFSFNCDFIFRDGIRNATAMLAVRFKNDSIASRYIRLSSNTNYSVSVEDNSNLGIKQIRGFVYMAKNSFEQREGTYNLNLMFVHDISLVRMRSTGQVQIKPGASADDTIRKDSAPSRNVPLPNTDRPMDNKPNVEQNPPSRQQVPVKVLPIEGKPVQRQNASGQPLRMRRISTSPAAVHK